jgi:hypothetical protein
LKGGAGVGDDFLPVNTMYNLLSLNKKTKLFSNSSFNNIGNSKSPNSPLNQSESPHANAAGLWLLQPTINQINLPQFGSSNRSISNSEVTNNLVLSPVSGKKGVVKIHASQLSDVLKTDVNNQQVFKSGLDSFLTNDEYGYKKSPKEYFLDLYTEYSPTKRLNIMSKVFSSLKRYNSTISHILNFTDTFNTRQSDIQNYIIASTTGTYRIDSTKVLQLSIDFANNKIDQFNVIDYNNIRINLNLIDSQFVRTSNNVLNLQSKVLGTLRKKIFYSVSLGLLCQNDYIRSNLNSNRLDSFSFNLTSANLYTLQKRRLFQDLQLSYKFKDITIDIGAKVNSLRIKLFSTALEEAETYLFIEPYAFMRKKIGRNWLISSNISYSVTPPNIQYQYQQPILITPRMSEMNQPNLSLVRYSLASFQVQYTNLFRHIDAFAAYSFNKQMGGIYQFLQINQDRTIKTNLLLDEAAVSSQFEVGCAKYMSSISTRISISGQTHLRGYFNLLNSDNIRRNQQRNSSLQFEITNNKLKDFIISGIFQANYANSIFENESQQNLLGLGFLNRVTYKFFQKASFSVVSEFIKPDSRIKQRFQFTDALIIIPSLKDKIFFEFSLRNIFNTKQIVLNSVNDFSINSYALRLLPRHFLITSRLVF